MSDIQMLGRAIFALLDKYEKLEREADAGRALAKAVEKMKTLLLHEENPFRHISGVSITELVLTQQFFGWGIKQTDASWKLQRDDALSAYHTACGKGEGV